VDLHVVALEALELFSLVDYSSFNLLQIFND
jgi:hypothetical protein